MGERHYFTYEYDPKLNNIVEIFFSLEKSDLPNSTPPTCQDARGGISNIGDIP
jgi:hypothetical protein